eukprot:2002229-Rhodomonas_salina.2
MDRNLVKCKIPPYRAGATDGTKRPFAMSVLFADRPRRKMSEFTCTRFLFSAQCMSVHSILELKSLLRSQEFPQRDHLIVCADLQDYLCPCLPSSFYSRCVLELHLPRELSYSRRGSLGCSRKLRMGQFLHSSFFHLKPFIPSAVLNRDVHEVLPPNPIASACKDVKPTLQDFPVTERRNASKFLRFYLQHQYEATGGKSSPPFHKEEEEGKEF